MNKAMIIGGGVAVAALLAKQLAPKMGNIDWEKKLAAMPDDAPPKWMFNNITAIRENTDRILKLLDQERKTNASETATSETALSSV